MNLDEFTEKIKDVILEERPFSIKFYAMTNDIEQKIERSIVLICEHCNLDKIFAGVLYTCVKETATNASKANLKRVLFDINNLDINNDKDYEIGMRNFKAFLTEENCSKYARELKLKDYWINIKFEYNTDGIIIQTENSVPISKPEDQRLREKFKKSMAYDDIAQFYLDQADNTEGSGMGIALIIVLLKGLKIDPNLFRIGLTKNNHTFARLEIPITPRYVTLREKGLIQKQFEAILSKKS